jgi:hypothetical protein
MEAHMARKQKPVSLVPAKHAIDDALGLFQMAFGQGVGPLHVHHEAVREINKRFRASLEYAFDFQRFPNWQADWKKDAASVLGMMAAVGRLSAHIAMSDKPRRSVVNKRDFDSALRAVKKEHHFEPKTTRVVPLGKYCV